MPQILNDDKTKCSRIESKDRELAKNVVNAVNVVKSYKLKGDFDLL